MLFMYLSLFARACSIYKQYFKRVKLQTNNLLEQEYQDPPLKSSLCKFYDRYIDLVSKYNVSIGHTLTAVFPTY